MFGANKTSGQRNRFVKSVMPDFFHGVQLDISYYQPLSHHMII